MDRPAIDPAACEDCHHEEFRDWQDSPHANASLNDPFLRDFADQGRPNYCFNCHGSGYDPQTGAHAYEGVVCSSCHQATGTTEHPPAPVDISKASDSCAKCHSGAHAPTYDEWLVSSHNTAGIDCVDCHTPHNNGLILGDVNTTCGDCHQEAIEDEVHMSEDMTCVECHMKRRTTEEGTHVIATGHTMAIDPGICSDCHGNTHLLSVRDKNRSPEEINQIEALEDQVVELEDQAEKDRNSGLVGGAVGAAVLMGALFVLIRLRTWL